METIIFVTSPTTSLLRVLAFTRRLTPLDSVSAMSKERGRVHPESASRSTSLQVEASPVLSQNLNHHDIHIGPTRTHLGSNLDIITEYTIIKTISLHNFATLGPCLPPSTDSHMIFATWASIDSGVVTDAHRSTTFPFLSIRNFSKFH